MNTVSIHFLTPSGKTIIYTDSRWGRKNVLPRLWDAVDDGRLEVLGMFVKPLPK